MLLRTLALLLLALSSGMSATLGNYKSQENLAEEAPVLDNAAAEAYQQETMMNDVPVAEALVADEPVAEADVPAAAIEDAHPPATEEIIVEEPVVETDSAAAPAMQEPAIGELGVDTLVSGEAISEEAVPEEAVSEKAVSVEAVSEEAVSEKAVSDEAVPEEPVGESAAVDEPVDDSPVGDVPEANEAALDMDTIADAAALEGLTEEALAHEAPAEEAPAEEAPVEAEGNDIEALPDTFSKPPPAKLEDSAWGLNSIRDSFQAVNGYFDSLVELVGGRNGVCQYRCKYDKAPVHRPGYQIPEPNGCSSSLLGFQYFDMGVPAMTKCCDQLDMCYDTCGTNKYRCDSKFRWCLHGICSDLKKSLGFVSKVEACESVADALYNTVWTLGCRPYLTSQRAACFCEGEEKDEL